MYINSLSVLLYKYCILCFNKDLIYVKKKKKTVLYAGCSQFRCSIMPTITKRCLSLVFASIVVGSGIENSKVVFEIAPCKLGIAFSFIHKRAKNTAGRATSGTRVLYNFQQCIYKRNYARSDPITLIQ